MAAVAVGVMLVVGAVLAIGAASGSSARLAQPPAAGASQVSAVESFEPARASTALLPSADDAAEIAEAVRTSPFTSAVSPADYEVAGTKLAASDPTWASTELRPVVDDLDRAVGVLHEINGEWTLLQLGSYEVGCDITPPQVRDDLDLDCPPTAPAPAPVIDA